MSELLPYVEGTATRFMSLSTWIETDSASLSLSLFPCLFFSFFFLLQIAPGGKGGTGV